MKRDMDLVREILLAIEEGTASFGSGTDDGRLAAYPDEQVLRHIDLLEQAGFVKGVSALMGAVTRVQDLTWEGHDFLESVRDPEVWKETKSRLSKIGGWTADMLKDAATAYLKMKAKGMLGLDL